MPLVIEDDEHSRELSLVAAKSRKKEKKKAKDGVKKSSERTSSESTTPKSPGALNKEMAAENEVDAPSSGVATKKQIQSKKRSKEKRSPKSEEKKKVKTDAGAVDLQGSSTKKKNLKNAPTKEKRKSSKKKRELKEDSSPSDTNLENVCESIHAIQAMANNAKLKSTVDERRKEKETRQKKAKLLDNPPEKNSALGQKQEIMPKEGAKKRQSERPRLEDILSRSTAEGGSNQMSKSQLLLLLSMNQKPSSNRELPGAPFVLDESDRAAVEQMTLQAIPAATKERFTKEVASTAPLPENAVPEEQSKEFSLKSPFQRNSLASITEIKESPKSQFQRYSQVVEGSHDITPPGTPKKPVSAEKKIMELSPQSPFQQYSQAMEESHDVTPPGTPGKRVGAEKKSKEVSPKSPFQRYNSQALGGSHDVTPPRTPKKQVYAETKSTELSPFQRYSLAVEEATSETTPGTPKRQVAPDRKSKQFLPKSPFQFQEESLASDTIIYKRESSLSPKSPFPGNRLGGISEARGKERSVKAKTQATPQSDSVPEKNSNTLSSNSKSPFQRNSLAITADTHKRGSSLETSSPYSPRNYIDRQNKAKTPSPKSPFQRNSLASKLERKTHEQSPKSQSQRISMPPPSGQGGLDSKRKMFDNRAFALPSPIQTTSPHGYAAALATPARGKKKNLVSKERPSMQGLGIAISPLQTPRAARKLGSFFEENSYRDSAVNILEDASIKEEVESLVEQIESANGFPKTRRPSLRDNPLISDVKRVIQNDPSLTEIVVDNDMVSFGTISKKMLTQFLDSLRINLHLKSITFKGLELRNDLLYGLAPALESNFVIEKLDFSDNCFTNEGLAEFCQCLSKTNNTCIAVNLKNQRTPISIASQEDVLEAFRENKSLTNVQLDFQSEDGERLLEEIMKRNKSWPRPIVDRDLKLLGMLKEELKRTQELFDDSENNVFDVPEDDWDYLYELAVLFDKHKLKEETPADPAESKPRLTEADIPKDGKDKSEFLFGKFKEFLEEQAVCFNTNGSFLTDEFISKYFVENQEKGALVFDFHGQWKLFKRFPVHDPDRARIVTKFVDAIVSHPRMNEITGINMAAAGCGDDFLITLSDRCLEDTSLLPNLQMVNFETNYINEPGMVALSKLIASQTTCRYLQVVRLENQVNMTKSKAETALARAMYANRSVVVMSLRVRNMLERQQISEAIVRNVDLLRKARQKHYKDTGTQRERNKMEQFFDKIAADDPSIAEVALAGDRKFLSLSQEEMLKAASSFATNTHVKKINFNSCSIDDDFTEALAKTFETNCTIEKVSLEGNSISGDGIKDLFQGLAKNRKISELRLYNQSKMVVRADEDYLADFLESNHTIMKIGMDLRSQMARVKLDRQLGHNRNNELRQSAQAKGGEFSLEDGISCLKF